MSGVGFVTGLAAEAALLTRFETEPLTLGTRVSCVGADSARAASAAEMLVLAGAGALISFGIAGGLDPDLRPGTLLLSDRVIAADGKAIAANETWRRAVLHQADDRNLPVAGGTLAGSDEALRRPGDKAALREHSGARAVDMESHAVGRVAQRSGLPFLVVRAVADPAERALPALIEGSIDVEGRPRIGLVMGRLALAPWELGALLRLRRDASAALATLEQAIRILGPVLANHPGR